MMRKFQLPRKIREIATVAALAIAVGAAILAAPPASATVTGIAPAATGATTFADGGTAAAEPIPLEALAAVPVADHWCPRTRSSDCGA